MFNSNYLKSFKATLICLRIINIRVPTPIKKLFLDSLFRLYTENIQKKDFHLLAKYENNQFFQLPEKYSKLKYAYKSGNMTAINIVLQQKYIRYDAAINGACFTGNIDIVKHALNLSYNTELVARYAIKYNQPEIYNFICQSITPTSYHMYLACKFNNHEIRQLLINQFDINLKGLCRSNQLELFKANFNIVHHPIYNCIYVTCKKGYIEFTKYLLEIINTQKLDDFVMLACYNDNALQMIQLLESIGAQIGNYTLHKACKYNRLDVVKYLTEKYIFRKDCYSNTKEIIDILIEKKITSPNNILQKVNRKIHPSIVEHLIYLGGDDYVAIFKYACITGHMNLLNLAILHEAVDWNKGLNYAVKAGQLNIVKLMIEKGANQLMSALYKACKYNHTDMVKYLINYAQPISGCLERACYNNNYVVALLITSYLRIICPGCNLYHN